MDILSNMPENVLERVALEGFPWAVQRLPFVCRRFAELLQDAQLRAKLVVAWFGVGELRAMQCRGARADGRAGTALELAA